MTAKANETAAPPLRLAIVEDQGLLRDLLGQVLGALPGLTVVGAYADAEETLRELPSQAVDVLLLDIQLGPGLNGVDLGIELRQRQPALGLVLLSNLCEPSFLARIPSHQRGGWSYLHKDSVADAQALVRAIRGSAQGQVVMDARLMAKAVGPHLRWPELGERANEIMALVAQGYSNARIAKQLHLAEKSVEGKLTQIYRQLGISTSNPKLHARVQACLSYLNLDG